MSQFQIIIGCQFVNKGISQEVISSVLQGGGRGVGNGKAQPGLGTGKHRHGWAREATWDPACGGGSGGTRLRIAAGLGKVLLPGEQIPAGIRGIVKHSRPAIMKCHSAPRSASAAKLNQT